MNITLVRESFLETLSRAGFFISNKISDLKIFKSVLITAKQEGIFIQTTNVNEYFLGEIGGKVLKTGEVLVDYKTLLEIVKNLNDVKVTLETTEKQLVIRSKTGQIKLATLDSVAFPKMGEQKNPTPLPLSYFQAATLEGVLLSCASDEARPILTGACFDRTPDETRIIGTDGFRMSVYSLAEENKETGRVILSGRSLSSILRVYKNQLKQVFYVKEEGRVYFQGEGVTVSTKTLEGEFPPYEKVVPQSHETRITLKRTDFQEAIKGTALFAKEGSNMVNLEVKANELVVSSPGTGMGEAVFRLEIAEKEGKDNKIVFNYRYLLDFLNLIEGDEVVLEMVNAFAPGVFRSHKNPSFLHIIMPIRSQE